MDLGSRPSQYRSVPIMTHLEYISRTLEAGVGRFEQIPEDDALAGPAFEAKLGAEKFGASAQMGDHPLPCLFFGGFKGTKSKALISCGTLPFFRTHPLPVTCILSNPSIHFPFFSKAGKPLAYKTELTSGITAGGPHPVDEYSEADEDADDFPDSE